MPGLNGIEAARRLKKSNPDAKLMILTMHADLSFVSAALGFEVCYAISPVRKCWAPGLLASGEA